MTRIPGFLLAVALGIAACAPAHAQFEVGYAHVDEIDGQTSQGFVASWLRPIERWRDADVHAEVLFGGVLGRDGVPGVDGDDIYFLGAGLRKHFGGLFIGGGVVVLDHKNTLLSSTGQFVTSLGYTHGSWVIAFRHISNANTAGNNDGENLLSLSYRW